MKKITTLEEAFIHGLSDAYSAEKQMVKALPKLAKASTSPELAEGFMMHLEETENQVIRIEQLVEVHGLKLERMKCKAMEGLVEEGNETVKEIEKGSIRDVMLIAGGQKVEHYEIATYGCLVEMAKKLGYTKGIKLLEATLAEEKATDEKLTQIALNSVHDEALGNPKSSRKKAA